MSLDGMRGRRAIGIVQMIVGTEIFVVTRVYSWRNLGGEAGVLFL